jgi:hypothetical protein
MCYLGGTSRTAGEAEESDLSLSLTSAEFTLNKVRVVAQAILDQLLNSCMRSVKCCLIYDHDPLERQADLFAGLRCGLQELGVNENCSSLGKPELMGKLVNGVCRVRVSSNIMR